MKGWKISSPRDDFAKGEWWKLFGDRELDLLEPQVSISNQTLKQDEANYREALALIAEARAGLFPTVSFNPSLTRSTRAGRDHDDGRGADHRELDAGHLGQGAAGDRRTRRGRAGQRRRSRQRDAFRAVGPGAGLCAVARERFLIRFVRGHGQTIPAFSRHHSKPVQCGHRGQIRRHHRAGAGARRAGVGNQHRRRSATERACDRSADGPAAIGIVDFVTLRCRRAFPRSRSACRRPCWSAGRTSPRPSG